MKEILNWVKANKKKITLVIIIAFSLPLIIIHLLFKWYWGCDFLVAEWNASDIISYIVGFEAFLGTVCLGIVATNQTSMANTMNKRMQENNELQNKFERQPSVMLADWNMQLIPFINCVFNSETIYYTCKGFITSDDDACLITLTLVNSSNIFLELKLLELVCTNDESNPFQCKGDAINSKKDVMHIVPYRTEEIKFLIDKKHFGKLSGTFCNLKLILTNSMGERYLETIKFVIAINTEDCMAIMIKEYNITVFESAGNGS